MKTRLAASIGEEKAAAIAHAFLQCLIARLEVLDSEKQLGFAPMERRRAFQDLAPTWTVRPQSDGDLGNRMTAYFESAFADGYDRVVLLGADCPSVPHREIHAAMELLETKEVVLGPAEDGGYYLVAARPPLASVAPLFAHGQWGDGDVLQRTLALASRQGISVGLTQPWHDVDEMEDLERLLVDLSQELACPHLIAMKRRIDNILEDGKSIEESR